MSVGNQHYYFGNGDHVTMRGGSGNIGIDKRVTPAQEMPQAVAEALSELLTLIQELRAQAPPVSSDALDDLLPVLRPEADVQPPERHRALLAVAGIAATIGAFGVPVVEAVNKVLELMGAK
ncbi:hypothetical protein [Streptomyces niveus]|uniref:hypothetical protein n=1 Tax=Streptomyces niveus TaxID=193462 RepID=UPI00344840B3